MNRTDYQRLKRIFYSVSEMEPSSRDAFLDSECAGDSGIRGEIEKLLSSLDSDFLEAPAATEHADLLVESGLEAGQVVGHYEIRKKLGAGGMGEVYLARDTVLDRPVALKLLPALFTSDPDWVRRFRQEVRAASALNHPNVLTIHEIGVFEETHFIATEYIEGVTLRSKLSDGALGIEETLDIAIQTATAMDAVHHAGIVHRDIKPENIMVRANGLVKILDFGLAKQEASEQPDKLASTPGIVFGTVAYMSPEQVRGLKVDARTDIWSLGVVLFEMLTGRQPFQGDTKADIAADIVTGDLHSLETFGSKLSTKLPKIISRALEKDKENRYGTAAELFRDLQDLRTEFISGAVKVPALGEDIIQKARNRKRVAAIAGVLLLLVTGAALFFGYFRNSTTQIESIAVTPFVNETGNPDLEYLSDGMTVSVISSLSKLPDISVKARSSVFRYKDTSADAQTIGRELGVQALLIGRLVQRGNDITLFVELIEPATEKILWSENYNRSMTNLVTLQGDIARDVSRKLRTKLSTARSQQLAKSDTTNAEAYQLYLQGRYHWNKREPEDLRKSIDYFNAAILLDPDYARAYAGLADTYAMYFDYIAGGKSSAETMTKAKAAALKALSLDEGSAEAHASLGLILHQDYDFTEAEREFKRAIDLDPDYAAAHQWYGVLLRSLGRFDEMFAEHRRAAELEPLSALITDVRGAGFSWAERYDEALVQFNKSLELEPKRPIAHAWIAYAYWGKGDYPKAVDHFAKAKELRGSLEVGAKMRKAFVDGGWHGFLHASVEDPAILPWPYERARYYATLGQKERAFEQLNRAYEVRESRLRNLKIDPFLESIRDDPRYAELVRKVGFPE
jgi:eukaryotic-like serine/threonine-protein kinase